MSRRYNNNSYVFFYLCGEYITKQPSFMSLKELAQFTSMKLGDEVKSQAPHNVCKYQTETLNFWSQNKVNAMKFGVSPGITMTTGYFCMMNKSGQNWHKKNS